MSGVVSVNVIFCLIIGISSGISEIARYDNYRVYEVLPHTQEQIDILNEMKESSDSLIFIESANRDGDIAHIIVAPHKFSDFTSILEKQNVTFSVVENNIQDSIDAQNLRFLSKKLGKFDWTSYQPLIDIHSWLDSLEKDYPDQVEVLIAGKSYENRDIKGVKVSYKKGNPGVFIEGGIHAREWISPATVTYMLNELLTSSDESVRNIAENYDWYIFPSVNPDGYVYTFTSDRLWRKTRTPYGSCYGADPNRNWDFHWAEAGTSSQKCSETYGGPKPFSEVETKALSEFITSLKGKIQAYISFHSYSQLLLFPYGHTGEHTSNHDDLLKIGKATIASLAKRYGTKYSVGNIYDAIYPASGASTDWAYGTLNVSVAYTYELRPSGYSWKGFQLPEKQIIPTGEETLDSLVTLLDESKKLGYYSN